MAFSPSNNILLYIVPLIHACCSRWRCCKRLQRTHCSGRASGSWGIGSSTSLDGHPKVSVGPQPQLSDINAPTGQLREGCTPSCSADLVWSLQPLVYAQRVSCAQSGGWEVRPPWLPLARDSWLRKWSSVFSLLAITVCSPVVSLFQCFSWFSIAFSVSPLSILQISSHA